MEKNNSWLKGPEITGEEILTQYDEFDIGEKPIEEFFLGFARNGEKITDLKLSEYAINSLNSQPVNSEIRNKFLNAIKNEDDEYIEAVCKNVVEYFKSHCTSDEFLLQINSIILRFTRFTFDLPNIEKITEFFKLLIADPERKNASVILHLLTNSKHGKVFIKLLLYVSKKEND